MGSAREVLVDAVGARDVVVVVVTELAGAVVLAGADAVVAGKLMALTVTGPAVKSHNEMYTCCVPVHPVAAAQSYLNVPDPLIPAAQPLLGSTQMSAPLCPGVLFNFNAQGWPEEDTVIVRMGLVVADTVIGP